MLRDAGVPDGVFNVVHGDKVAVDAILEHPDIEAVSFVGSTPIARYIYETGTKAGKRVQALGGAKNHMIVLPDADIDMAADAAVSAGYGSAGERCMAIATIVAVGDVADPLVEAIKARLPKITVGPGSDPSSEMGPLVTKQHRDKVASYLDSGPAQGADVVTDGREHPLYDESDGFFLGVSLIDHVTPAMDAYRDEIFGPVLTVMRVKTYDEAVQPRQRQPVRQRDGDLHPRRRGRPAVPVRGQRGDGRHQRADPGPGRVLQLRRLEELPVRRPAHVRPRGRPVLHAGQDRDLALAGSGNLQDRSRVPPHALAASDRETRTRCEGARDPSRRAIAVSRHCKRNPVALATAGDAGRMTLGSNPGGLTMTEYQRTTTQQTNATDAYGAPAPPTTVRTTDTYVAPGPGGATLAARIVTFAFGILQVLLDPPDHPAPARRQPRQRHRQLRVQHHPALCRAVHQHVLAQPRGGRPGLRPGHHRDRRAHRLDARRGVDPGRDPDLLATVDRDRLTPSLRHADAPSRRVRAFAVRHASSDGPATAVDSADAPSSRAPSVTLARSDHPLSAVGDIRTQLTLSLRVVRAILGSPALRHVELAFLLFNAVEFGTWVAMLLYAYSATGPASVGLVALIQLVPAAVVAPLSANLADRYRRDRVLFAGYLVQAVAFGADGGRDGRGRSADPRLCGRRPRARRR